MRRTFPTQPKRVHLAGMAGINRVRFLAIIEHGRGTREIAVDVPPDLILQIADALRATAGHACDRRSAKIADAREGEPNVGHAIWHVEHPNEPMPCIDQSTVIDMDALGIDQSGVIDMNALPSGESSKADHVEHRFAPYDTARRPELTGYCRHCAEHRLDHADRGIRLGSCVRVVHQPDRDRGYVKEARAGRKSGDMLTGIVIAEHDSHGLCYEVKFSSGAEITYDFDELVVVE